MKEERFPIYYSGSSKAFEFLGDARIEGTLLLPQPFVMSFKPDFLNVSQRCFLEPLLTVIIVNEDFKDTIVKNGFKTNIESTVYLYFPFEVRVDEILYVNVRSTQKKGSSGFDELIKQVPRSQRQYFAKLVVWEQGRGEHSPQAHIDRFSAMISRELKISIERRIAALAEESARAETEPLSFGKIARLHVLKLKLIKIYEYLRMHSQITPILMEEYQYICLNKFYFKNTPLAQCRKLSYNPTLINVELVIELLHAEDINLLEFMTHCYYQIFMHLVRILKLVEALLFLRDFLSFAKPNILEKSGEATEIVLQNVWIIQLVESSLSLIQAHKNLLTQTRRAEIDVLQASLKLFVKDVLEQTGCVLYGFSQSLFHTLNVDLELEMLVASMKRNKPIRQRQEYNKILQEGKQKEMIGEIANAELRKTLSSYAEFIECYVRYIEEMVGLLKETKLKRVLLHLGITLLKAKVEFPWLKIETDFEVLQSDAVLESWKGLLLLRSIYLYLYYRSTNSQELQRREIARILSNDMLTDSHRSSLIELLSSDGAIVELPQSKLGEVQSISISQAEENSYKVVTVVGLEFPCAELFQRLEVQLSNPKNPHMTQTITYRKEEIESEGSTKLRATTTFGTLQRLTKKVQRVDVYNRMVRFVLPLAKCVTEAVFEFNGASLAGSWKYEPKAAYCHLMTPYAMRVCCMRNSKSIRIRYAPTRDIKIASVLIADNQSLVVPFDQGQLTIELTKLRFTGTLELQLMLLVTKSDPALRSLLVEFEFVLENDNVEVLTHEVAFRCVDSFLVNYQAGDRLFQYGITNTQPRPVVVLAKGQQYTLEESETVSTRSESVEAGLDQRLLTTVSLREICTNWHPVASDREMFKLRLLDLPLRVLQTASIESEEVGLLTVVAHEGYELVGKTKGLQRYKSGKCLQLKIVPVRTGKIVLPEIYIDGKKGQWSTPVVLDVE